MHTHTHTHAHTHTHTHIPGLLVDPKPHHLTEYLFALALLRWSTLYLRFWVLEREMLKGEGDTREGDTGARCICGFGF